MRAISRALITYGLPPVLLDLARMVRAHIRHLGTHRQLIANAAWCDRYKGERVYVIGNGPSVGDFDLEELIGQKVIVMNNFHHAPWKHEVEIVAHCIAEPRSSPSWDREEIRAAILGTASQSYWLDMSSFGEIGGFGFEKVLHHVLPAWEPGLWGERTIRLDRSTLSYQTTAQLAIQVAMYMGFREIVLLGFDHDWLATPDYSRHFYASNKDSTDTLHTMSYLQIIRFMQRMWEIYERLDESARRAGTRIENASSKTYLDIFERRPR